LAEHHQDLFAVERKRHHRQGNQQARPKPDAKRAPNQARIAGAECLRGQWCHSRHQAHSEGEADEEHRMRERRRSNRLVPEASDERKIGRHHRDLPELRQRHRHRQLERLAQLERKVTAGRRRCDRSARDLVKGCHGGRLARGAGKAKRAHDRGQVCTRCAGEWWTRRQGRLCSPYAAGLITHPRWR
jgi:hypothetical protein